MNSLFGAHKSFLLLLIFLPLIVGKGLPPHHFSFHKEIKSNVAESQVSPKEEGTEEESGMELFPTGSSLPDCSHACGPCFPCKRVMVSFKCSIGESCPIVYKCMCKGKYYHVPSA